MRDYTKSYFWFALRLVGVYPHDVRVWWFNVVTLFHRVTFWAFFDHEKAQKKIEGFVRDSQAMEDEWERIETSL